MAREEDGGGAFQADSEARKIPARRELFVVVKQEEIGHSPSKWDTLERASKTLSIAAIPVVLAVMGVFAQRQLQDQTVGRDYVQLAVSILKEPEDAQKVTPKLRAWAVDLLNDNSPTKLSKEVIEELKSGQSILPAGEVTTKGARPLDQLHPAVAELARQFVAKANGAGIEVRIIKTLVTTEEQEHLYKQGLTKARGGKSTHNLGLAFDVVPVVDGKPSFNDVMMFEKLGTIGKSLGLTWGGDWSAFKDYPHFELRPELDGRRTPASTGRPASPPAR